MITGSNPRHFRVRYRRAGGHVHVRLFSSTAPHLTHAKCGDLTFDERDWPAFQACFRDCGEAAVTFVDELTDRGNV